MEIDINNKNIRDERACYEKRHEVIFIQLSSWNDILHLNMYETQIHPPLYVDIFLIHNVYQMSENQYFGNHESYLGFENTGLHLYSIRFVSNSC